MATRTRTVTLIGEKGRGTDVVGVVDLPLRFGVPEIILYRGRVFKHSPGGPTGWWYYEADDVVRVVGKKIVRV